VTGSSDRNMGDELNALLAECVALNASDIHLVSGVPPHFRQHGELRPATGRAALSAEHTTLLARALKAAATTGKMDGESLDAALAQRGSMDGAMSSPEGVRFRFNIFRRQSEISIALRRLEDRFRTLAELGMPESLYNLCDLRDGLVVISGPTGAGKSTTLATLLDRINQTRSGHIITIEDPIEYLHAPVRCVVNQRQVGLDAPSFNGALVDAMRQDPDVILVGEIRDLDTIRTGIIAAETGHLVFTTLHAGDCVGAVERLVAVFPSDEQEGIRRQLSLVLRAIVAQHLLVAVKPDERHVAESMPCVAASEILMVTPAVANLIATGKSAQIYSAMETGTSLGMQTLEQDLARLWNAGRITEAAAMALARNPSVVRDRAALARRPAPSHERARGVAR
jgi:twitching motility protein PilT